MIKIFRAGGGGVVDGEGVAVKDARSGLVGGLLRYLYKTS